MTRAPLAAALLAATGCVGVAELKGRTIELEVRVAQLQREVDALREAAAEADAVRAVRTLAPADGDAQARVAALEAQVTDLRARVAVAEATLAAQGAATPAGPATEPRGPTATIPTPGAGAHPPGGKPLVVLAVGSGALLVRTGQGLKRVELAGVVAPRRAEEYQAAPGLLAEHRRRLRGLAAGDAAWEASRQRLEEAIAGRPAELSYPGERRAVAGVARAYAAVDGRDLGAALIADGFALAGDEDHPRGDAYRAAEAEARAAGRGLHGGADQGAPRGD